MASTILPPIPDELIEARDVARIVGWLWGSGIPARFRKAWLKRWARSAGVQLTREDLAAVFPEVTALAGS